MSLAGPQIRDYHAFFTSEFCAKRQLTRCRGRVSSTNQGRVPSGCRISPAWKPLDVSMFLKLERLDPYALFVTVLRRSRLSMEVAFHRRNCSYESRVLQHDQQFLEILAIGAVHTWSGFTAKPPHKHRPHHTGSTLVGCSPPRRNCLAVGVRTGLSPPYISEAAVRLTPIRTAKASGAAGRSSTRCRSTRCSTLGKRTADARIASASRRRPHHALAKLCAYRWSA
jgi:hypothetical protein